MFFISETRHDIVGLRLEIDARDPSLRRRVEEGKPRAGNEIMYQRGDEHRLPRAGEPGDAELERRRDQATGEIADAAENVPGGLAIARDRHDRKRPLRSWSENG